jgi:hypothetical protein
MYYPWYVCNHNILSCTLTWRELALCEGGEVVGRQVFEDPIDAALLVRCWLPFAGDRGARQPSILVFASRYPGSDIHA